MTYVFILCIQFIGIVFMNYFFRSSTQGKGEFTMEYKQHQVVPKDTQENLIKIYTAKLAADEDK